MTCPYHFKKFDFPQRNSFAKIELFKKINSSHFFFSKLCQKLKNNDSCGCLEVMVIERVYPSDFTSRKQSIHKFEKCRFWGLHLKVVISKSGLAVSVHENANISGTT
eukprot:UN20769